jgi:T5SS/PEP-CTERM-associated repeat protein
VSLAAKRLTLFFLVAGAAAFARAAGGPGNALHFDGIDDYVVVSNSAALNLWPMTVTAWLRTSQTNGRGNLAIKASPSVDGVPYWFFSHNFGTLSGGIIRSFANVIVDGNGSVADGLWHHVALTVSTNGATLYVDGVSNAAAAWAGSPGPPNPSRDLSLGGPSPFGGDLFQGELDEVRLWESELTGAQILANMNRGLTGLETGLIAYYRCDETGGMLLRDSAPAGGNNDGTLTNGIAFVPSGILPFTAAAETLLASAVGAGAVVLNGLANPEGTNTSAWFEWGTTTNYGNLTPPQAVGSGAGGTNFSQVVLGLTPITVHHCRAVASNIFGVALGNNQVFPTTVPGDLNGDSIVDDGELNTVLSNYFPHSPWLALTNTCGLGGTNVTFALTNPTACAGHDSQLTPNMKTFPIILTVTLLATPALRAQLVADGATNTLSNVTNTFPGTVIVGTNGSFTLLVLSDNALVTNSAHFVIGANTTAKSNEVRLISSTARWQIGGSIGFRFLLVGSNGASSRLVVSNGAQVVGNGGSYIGFGAPTSNNVAVVTGAGSVWSEASQVSVGQSGVGNQLIVTNGGQVLSGDGRVGSVGSNNQAVVTGAGSQWTNQTDFYVGVGGGGNRLLLENGGRLADGLGYLGANATSRSNEVVVTGNGSIWSNRLDLQIGQNGAFNRLVISNGGWVFDTNSTAGVNAIATNNEVVVTGNGSLWSNRGDVTLGFSGSGNQLTVSNGATVVSSNGFLGFNTSSSSNLVAVTGPGSYWSNVNRLHVGESGSGNFLIVSNGALVGSTDASLGETAASGNNLAVVSGTNSAWTNRYNFRVGSFGSGNRLVVEDGGLVANEDSGFVGAIGSRNEAVVTGPGSRWNNNPELYVGYQGTNNQLTVSNSAVVRDDIGYVGHDIFSSNNVALVTGSSSVWSNGDALYIGRFGSRNRLVVTNGGMVFAGSNVFVGESVTTGSNRVVVDGGTLLASNSSGTATLDVRRGTNVLNAGLIEVDRLVLTNSQGFFQFNGGTLITRGAFITNVTPFVVGVSGSTPAVWDVRAGTSNFLSVPVSLGQFSSFNQLLVTNGALLTSGGGFIGLSSNAKSNIAVVAGPGSKWANSAVLQVGTGGSFNSLVVSNGGAVSNNIGYLGIGGSNCLALVTGAGSLWTNAAELDVGSGGTSNQLVISDGGTVKSQYAYVGLVSSDSDNVALVTGTNALWSTTGDLFFGRSGPRNQLVVSNGGWLACGVLHLGLDATSSSNVAVVTGAGSVLTNSALNVGRAGPGNQLIVSNGGEVRGGTTTVGFETFGNNDLALVTDPGSALKGDLNLGFSGAFAGLVVSNGAAAYGNYGIAGFNTSGSNSLALLTGAGSVWSSALELTVGLNSRRNQVVVSNGAALFAGNALYVGFNASSTDNRIVVDGGTLRVTNLTGTGMLDIRRGTNVLNAGLIEADIVRMTNGPSSRLEINGGTLSAKSSRIASGTIFRIGTGVSPATLLLAGNGIHDFGGNLVVTVSSNAVLTGNGTLLGGFTISSGGKLLPGTSVGKMVFSNSPALQGAVIMEISKNGAALTNDQIQVNGALNYNGSLIVSNLGPDALTAGDAFRLFAASSYAGSFSTLSLPTLDPGLAWTNKLLVDGSIEVVISRSNRFWTNVLGGSYQVAANWLDNVVPLPPDDAYFTNNAGYQVSWSADAIGANAFFNAGSGTVTQAIGAASWTLTNSYIVGQDSAATAAVTHVSGSLFVTNSAGTAQLKVGEAGRGTFNLAGGEVVTDSLLVTNGAKSVFNFTGGTLRTRNTTVSFSSGTFVVGAAASPATFELLGGTHTFQNALSTQPGSLLNGTGTISANVTLNGSVSPGPAQGGIGRLDFNSGALNFLTTCTNFLEINKAAGTNDAITSTSTMSMNGALVVTNLAGTLTNGDRFQLFSGSFASGGFSKIILPPLAPGLSWRNNTRKDGSLEVVATPVRDFGDDVSHFQGATGVSQSSWNQMFAEGKRFSFIKATEGLTGPNDLAMSNNVDRAVAAGLLVGVYHHAHPENRPNTNGAVAEATNFLAWAGNAIGPGRLRPVLVLESGTSMTSAELTDWVIAFSNEITNNRGAGAAPIIYTLQNIANGELDSRVADYDLWIRAVSGGAIPEADDPPPQTTGTNALGVFNNWSFWQYSDVGSSGGISPLDLDVCHSEYKPLNSYLIPGPPPTPIQLAGLTLSGGAAFQFSFTNTPGALFTVLAATNPALPLSNWTVLGAVSESPPGQFQFSDSQATNNPLRFYRVRSP